jgi:hypothetical protein
MVRTLVAAGIALALCAGSLLAEVIQGKLAKVDPDKSTLRVTANGRSQEYPVEKDAAVFYKPTGKGKKAKAEDVPGGLKGLKEGVDVMVWTEKKDGKEVITQVRVEQAAPVKKKDK